MNRRAKIVCCDCSHRLESRFWVLRKRAPYYKGADLRVFVENSVVPGNSKDVNACVDRDNNNVKKAGLGLPPLLI